MAFTQIERMAGAEDVLPTMLDMIDEAEAGLVDLKPRSALALAHLIRLLSSKLTAEGLLNEGSQLFQPGGVTDTVTLPVPGGKEHITFRVTVDRSAQPQRTSRIAKAKVELMPAGFAGVKGDDELSSGSGVVGTLRRPTQDQTSGVGYRVGGQGRLRQCAGCQDRGGCVGFPDPRDAV